MTSSPATELVIDYALSSYDYDLPSDRIAQDPVTPRDASRLLVVDAARDLHHHHFYDLPNFLQAGDQVQLRPACAEDSLLALFQCGYKIYGISAAGRPLGSEPVVVCEWSVEPLSIRKQ